MTHLAETYQKVASTLQQSLHKTNRLEVPRLQKIVVNVGMGRAHEDASYKELVVTSLAQITGQRPVVTKARKSIAGFKLREQMEIGCMVTLRGQRMEDFYARLVHVVLPRVRDFRGLSPRGFDGHGNYSLGIQEHTVFPEISADDVTQTHPLQVTIVTSTFDDIEAEALLRELGMPLTGEARSVEGDQHGA